MYEFLCLYFGLGPAPQISQKIAKHANDNFKQNKHQNNNLLRRHATDLPLFRRDSHELIHNNLPSATSRICHKMEKVCGDTSAGNRLFGPGNQLCHTITFFKQNKNSESSFRISKFVKEFTNISSGVFKSNIQAVLSARLNCRFDFKYNKYHLCQKTFLI